MMKYEQKWCYTDLKHGSFNNSASTSPDDGAPHPGVAKANSLADETLLSQILMIPLFP